MSSLDSVQAFLGWCTVINMAALIFGSVSLVTMRSAIAPLHGALFGLDESDLSRAYFQWLAQYKIAIFVFNLVPYIAVRLIA